MQQMGDCKKWTPHAVAAMAKVGQQQCSARCMLLLLLGYFVYFPGNWGTTAELHVQAASAASVEGLLLDRATPTASGALAQTLKLLNPSSSTVRTLRAVENQISQLEQAPIPVCSQSKYLCQVYTLHSEVPDRRRIASTQNDWLSSAHEVKRPSSVIGLRSSLRFRRLATTPFKIPKQLQQEAANAQAHTGKPSARKTRMPVLAENLPIKVPSFTQVPQIRGRGGVFLPVRVQACFAASGDSALEEQPDANTEYSSDGSNGANEEDHTVGWFSDVLRFFQVEVVPSAIWWLQRTVTVDRLLGPLTIKVSEKRNKK